MTVTVLAACLLTSTATPNEALAAAARDLGFTAYQPGRAAQGYELAGAETALHEGQRVLRVTFVNKKSHNSFELVQSKAKGAVGSLPRAALQAGLFPVSIMPDDTVVSIRKGQTDILLVGSLLSEPSAKTMLERSVAYRP